MALFARELRRPLGREGLAEVLWACFPLGRGVGGLEPVARLPGAPGQSLAAGRGAGCRGWLGARRPMMAALCGRPSPGKAPASPPITARSNLPRAHQPLWRPAAAGAGANGRRESSLPSQSAFASCLPLVSAPQAVKVFPSRPPGSPPIAAGSGSAGQSARPRRHLCGGRQEAGWRREGRGGGGVCVTSVVRWPSAAERSGGRGRAWGCGRRRRPRRPRGHG